MKSLIVVSLVTTILCNISIISFAQNIGIGSQAGTLIYKPKLKSTLRYFSNFKEKKSSVQSYDLYNSRVYYRIADYIFSQNDSVNIMKIEDYIGKVANSILSQKYQITPQEISIEPSIDSVTSLIIELQELSGNVNEYVLPEYITKQLSNSQNKYSIFILSYIEQQRVRVRYSALVSELAWSYYSTLTLMIVENKTGKLLCFDQKFENTPTLKKPEDLRGTVSKLLKKLYYK